MAVERASQWGVARPQDLENAAIGPAQRAAHDPRRRFLAYQ
jgi:hypothetical protein